jgi:hypothetical protein
VSQVAGRRCRRRPGSTRRRSASAIIAATRRDQGAQDGSAWAGVAGQRRARSWGEAHCQLRAPLSPAAPEAEAAASPALPDRHGEDEAAETSAPVSSRIVRPVTAKQRRWNAMRERIGWGREKAPARRSGRGSRARASVESLAPQSAERARGSQRYQPTPQSAVTLL